MIAELDPERTAESRPPIAWSRADELAYEAARRRLGNSWGAWLRERLALAERLAVQGKTRTGPGAMDPPDGPVTPPPSRYRPHSPACGRNSKAKLPSAPKPAHKCLDCPVMVPAHWLRCGACGKVKHREQSTAAQKRLYWTQKAAKGAGK